MSKKIFKILMFGGLIFLLLLPTLTSAITSVEIELKKVNEPSTYYVFFTLIDPPSENITITRDGNPVSTSFTHATKDKTGEKIMVGADTYPTAGDYNYVVTIKNPGKADIVKTKKITVPTGSYVPPPPATTTTAPTIGGITLPGSNFDNTADLVRGIINWLLGFTGIVAIFAIIYSGIMYMTAGGDTTKAEAARKNLIWAITGIVIVILSAVIINWVVDIF